MYDILSKKLAENLQQLQTRLSENATLTKRLPPQLLAVSKGHSAAEIRALHALGQTHFGENYLQEALTKISALSDLPLSWHYIGRIQTNKIKLIATHFEWVHSLSSEKHANALNAARATQAQPLQCCLQVNLENHSRKAGISPEDIEALLNACLKLPYIRVRGLMTFPEPTPDLEAQRRPFRLLKECMERLVQKGYPLDTLSMGMSSDLQAAILEGSTWVRVGTALFGERQK